MIYLDYNATTPLCDPAKHAIQNALDRFGNPSGLYAISQDAHYLVEEARDAVAHLLGVNSYQLLFTSSATEASNQVLKGYFWQCQQANKACRFITTPIEHSCIKETLAFLALSGATVIHVPVDQQGVIDIAAYKETLTEPSLVTIHWVNNEVGTIQPIKELAKLAHDQNCLFHTDAVQAIGKLSDKVGDLDVDFASISAHKCYGPKGVGVLYARKDDHVVPLHHGGSQERRLRAGTENVIGISGMGAAFSYLRQEQQKLQAHYNTLRSWFHKELTTTLPQCSINTPLDSSISNTLNVSFPQFGLDGHALAIKLDLAGIAVATGSACSTGSYEASPVLINMGLDKDKINSAIRISLGSNTTQEELKKTIDVLRSFVK